MKVLVAVASLHGATLEIAERIAIALRRRGVAVTLQPAATVHTLDGYDAVVIGSAVYLGRWLRPARELVTRHRERLATLPVWLFSSGPVGQPPKPDVDPADITELSAMVRARGHRRFAGRLDRRRLRPLHRVVARAVNAPDGDFRDWSAVDAWAAEIADVLASGPMPAAL